MMGLGHDIALPLLRADDEQDGDAPSILLVPPDGGWERAIGCHWRSQRRRGESRGTRSSYTISIRHMQWSAPSGTWRVVDLVGDAVARPQPGEEIRLCNPCRQCDPIAGIHQQD